MKDRMDTDAESNISKSKKTTKMTEKQVKDDIEQKRLGSIPIANLPDKYLEMQVTHHSKMRKILHRAFTDFPKYEAVLWYSKGQNLYKAISCSEIFKTKYPDLHQLTKIRMYQAESTETKSSEKDKESHCIPEIFILLTKSATYENEDGYQAPGDLGYFPDAEEVAEGLPKQQDDPGASGVRMTSLAAEEFAAMGLRTGKKRSRKEQFAETPSKKNKKKGGTGDSQ